MTNQNPMQNLGEIKKSQNPMKSLEILGDRMLGLLSGGRGARDPDRHRSAQTTDPRGGPQA